MEDALDCKNQTKMLVLDSDIYESKLRQLSHMQFERTLWENASADFLPAANGFIDVVKRNKWSFVGKVRQVASRSPRTRTVSKATAKTAGGGSGDPDPEPEPELPSYPFSLTLPALWQLLRPDNPGKNNLTKTLTDHSHLCASVSPIAFGSAA